MALAVLVAGGTAGHINAALSLGEFLTKNDIRIQYITGTRYLDKKLFNNQNAIFLDGRPLRTKNPIILFKNLLKNIWVFVGLLIKFILKRPSFVIGAGGYVCGPSLLAAWLLRIPIYIIEQNAYAGLTNKILARISKKIFTHFVETKGLEQFSKKIIVSGNPVRSKIKYKATSVKNDKTEINILVFGGSLGATQINDAIEQVLKHYPQKKYSILHQVGKDNLKTYQCVENITYEQVEYIEDMQQAYEWSDIIIARAGASTISELRIVSKSSILIPYPKATDNHQYFNAKQLQEEGNFYVEILDQTLYGKELAEKMMSAVNSIILENLFIGKESKQISATQIIFQEIKNDVWNK